eukprot:TRINITY_DN40267_c0_g1_i1.p1 TRINITY_DN40267_c0_g1~~TRINITY_DN40267_c0_g1_i1.p1  ORF type:complete len:368 (-),score=16.09 TRINITY_DN40267_c0_g1_i1:157-1203(-)
MTQIARCSGWHGMLTGMLIRSYLLLLLNFFVQSYLILMISEANQVMDVLGGKMHLCDFGKTLEDCPGDPSCLGPGGTELSPPRIYNYDIWAVRLFVRDSLAQVFPDHEDEIRSKVDPGEYGLENYWCRLICCFIFILSEVRDFYRTLSLFRMIRVVPSEEGEWIQWNELGADGIELSNLPCRIQGIPRVWKFVIFVTVIVPKVLLWWCVCWQGFKFLMETSGIVNLVLGAVAMDFILSVDELIFSCCVNACNRHILSQLQAFKVLPDPAHVPGVLEMIWFYIPRRLMLAVILTGAFLLRYYHENCEIDDSGFWVSKPMYLPTTTRYTFMNYIQSYVPTEATPFWTMPK